MKILAVDTTREFGSLALFDSGAVVEETLLHSPEGFSAILFDRLERLLARHDWSVDSVDCYAAASGPGSFTGVRIGLAAVKGLAEAARKPAVAVSSLQALASFGSAPLRAALLDARRGEIYGAVYDAGLRPVIEESVARFPAWLARLPQSRLEFVALDLTPFRPALAGTAFENAQVIEAPRAQAAAIARIAAGQFASGQVHDPADLDANYVRRSDAELLWHDH